MTLVLLLTAWPAAARPAGESLQIDDAACERVPRAAALVRSDYLIVPARHRSRSFPVIDVRRLFDQGEPDKKNLVKRSIAEENPVLVAARAHGSSEIVEQLWRPLPEGPAGRTPGSRENECRGAMIVVGYDDARYGGAFEVMRNCATDNHAESFFWVRYEDFDQFCSCAVEVIGRRGGAESPVELSGSLRFEDASGAVMPAQRQGGIFRLEQPYPSGTRFRVLVTSKGPAYVYVFASDLTQKIYPIFPGDGGSAYLAYQENRVAIPDKEKYLHLDDKPGTDYVCALYSTRKLDLSTLAHQMDGARGDFAARLQAALAKDLMPEARVRYTSSGEAGFAAESAERALVAVVVEIRHVR